MKTKDKEWIEKNKLQIKEEIAQMLKSAPRKPTVYLNILWRVLDISEVVPANKTLLIKQLTAHIMQLPYEQQHAWSVAIWTAIDQYSKDQK